jgi:hypothetical protein
MYRNNNSNIPNFMTFSLSAGPRHRALRDRVELVIREASTQRRTLLLLYWYFKLLNLSKQKSRNVAIKLYIDRIIC